MKTIATVNIASMRTSNFEHSFRPLYCFSRFAGLWPFSIIRDANGIIQSTSIGLFDVFWSLFIIFLNFAVSLNVYKKLKAQHENNAIDIQYVVFAIFEISSFLFTIIRISLDLINRDKLVNVLKRFNTFDKKVGFLL